MPFIGKQSSANSKIKKYSYTATTNQTNFAVVSGSGDEIQVFFNGVKLKETDDYTYSTSQVTLGAGASSGDIVDIHVFSSFLIADAVSSSTGGPLGTGNNEWSLPVTRASENGQFLQMSDISNGTTAWASTVIDPSITGVTGHLNATEATGEGGGGTLVITGADLGTNISQVTDLSICNSSGGSAVPATTKSITSSNTEITATWTGNESGYSTFSGVYYVKLTKSGKTSNIFNTTKQISADPSIESVTGANGDLFSGSVSASNLGTYGGTIEGGGQDSNTKLLLNFDRTGGTDIEDSSNTGGDGNKVTVNGNAVIKSSPFGDGKSAFFFDGDNDKLSIANHSDIQLDGVNSSNTIEFWIHPKTITTNDQLFARYANSGSADDHLAILDVSGSSARIKYWRYGTSGYTEFTTNYVIQTYNWYHIAVVNINTAVTIYINGKSEGTGTFTPSTSNHAGSSEPFTFGCWGTSNAFDGYMDEIRIVKGTAVYTSDFTPPTSRFSASDEANTKLLIHSNQTYDSSDNNLHIEQVGNPLPSPTTTNKYGGSAWRVAGSSASDVTSDQYLKVGNGNAILTSGDWTIEFWGKDTSASSTQGWFTYWKDSNNNFKLSNYGTLEFFAKIGGTSQNSGSTQSRDTSWHHYAVVYDDSTTTLTVYQDGSQTSQNTSFTLDINASSMQGGFFALGARTDNGTDFNQYSSDCTIDDFRITHAKVYTGNFTAPTSALTKTWSASTGIPANSTSSNVKLLVHGNHAGTDNFTDSATSGTTHVITPTGAYHSQAHGGIAPAMTFPASLKKTGSAGVYFDGTTGNHGLTITPANNTDLNPGTGDWTLDFWIYPMNTSDEYSGIFVSGAPSWVAGESKVWLYNNVLYIDEGEATNAKIRIYGTLSNNQWYHICFSKLSNNLRGFINGSEVSPTGNTSISDTDDWNFSNSSNGTYVGVYTSGGSYYNFGGYLDGLRFQKGIGYSTFTVPTKIYGAYFPTNPSVGTITITGATTDSTDIAFTEISSSLPNGLTLTDGGASGATDPNGASVSAMTAHITGTLTDSITSDTTTANIRIQAKANNDAKRITEVNESSGTGNVSITKKVGAPILFNARRYIGNALARDINGFGIRPDLIWVKNRDNSTASHSLTDSVRGIAGGTLNSDGAGAQDNTVRIDSFNSDGFGIKVGNWGYHNSNIHESFIAWAWSAGGAPSGTFPSSIPSSGIANGTYDSNSPNYSLISASDSYINTSNFIQTVNQNTGFSITKYKGTATSASHTGSFPHNLGGAVEFIIVKSTSHGEGWTVWHKDLASPYSTTNSFMRLDTNNAQGVWSGSSQAGWSTFHMGSATDAQTKITLAQGSAGLTHYTNYDYICYAWKSVAGVSKFGTYTGSGGAYDSSTGKGGVTDMGFKPRWLMVKNIGGTQSWPIFDSVRDSATEKTIALWADGANADTTNNTYGITFTSTGFTMDSGTTSDQVNANNGTYIYAAFA